MDAQELQKRYEAGERDFLKAKLCEANLRDAKLREIDLRLADLSNADLSGADLRGADLSYAKLIKADLSGANLGGARLCAAKLSPATLRNANLYKAQLQPDFLDLSDLRYADLSGADLTYANLSGALLGDAKLIGAKLYKANLGIWTCDERIDEGGPYSVKEESHRTDLAGADLTEADLSYADLSGAILVRAKLDRANIRGANLTDTDLHEAIISDDKADLVQAKGDEDGSNQGVRFDLNQTITYWKGLRFRSKAEVKIAEALDRFNVLYLPNCKARLDTPNGRRSLEPDFLICYEGRWGILEVDGPYHTSTRRVEEQERERLFRHYRILIVERFNDKKCYGQPDNVVREFLELLSKS